MKKYCIYCGQVLEEDQITCPQCNKEIINLDNDSSDEERQYLLANISDEDKHAIHRNCHKQINKANDNKNTSLVFLVTSIILLIIGGLFLFLSFRFNIYKKRVFSPGTVEFIVSVISLAVGATFLTIGSIGLVKSIKLRKRNEKLIELTK